MWRALFAASSVATVALLQGWIHMKLTRPCFQGMAGYLPDTAAETLQLAPRWTARDASGLAMVPGPYVMVRIPKNPCVRFPAFGYQESRPTTTCDDEPG